MTRAPAEILGAPARAAMHFRIRHSLHYRYARPVFLEPHTLRLTPRQDPVQRLLHHRLTVQPPDHARSEGLDAEGNGAILLWFDALRDRLDLEVEMEVETLRANPFDWIISEPAAQRLPFSYDAATSAALAPYLQRESPDPGVATWAAEQAAAVAHRTIDLLPALADTIHHGFQHGGRPDGDPHDPAHTLATRSGACRDTAMLYVAACRSLGLAARFVSGYSIHHPPDISEQELHAWAEVFVPGGGWRAWDPSLGLAVADGHVVLATAPDHRLAAPVSGSYRGTGVASNLDYRVAITVEPC